MQLRVPYTFTANVIPPKSIKERQTTQGGFVTVEIPELDDLDAPIATAWTDIRNVSHQTRWFDNSHWVPHKDFVDGNSYPVTTSILADKINNGDSGTTLSWGAPSSLKKLISGEIEPFDERRFRSVGETDQQAVINRILDSAKDSIIVENQLWKRCGEPYYRHNRHNIIRDATPAILYPDICYLDDEAEIGRTAFSAVQVEDFREFAIGPNSDRLIVPDGFLITVFVPESIKFDADAVVMLNTTSNFLEDSASYVGIQSPAYIHAWANLKSAHATAKETRSEEANNHVAETIYALSASAERDWNLERLAEAANRWNSRPIAIDVADAFKL